MINPFCHDYIEFRLSQTLIYIFKSILLFLDEWEILDDFLNVEESVFRHFTWKSRYTFLNKLIKSLLWSYLTGYIELVKSSFVIDTMAMNENVYDFWSDCLLIDITPLNIGECIVQTENNVEFELKSNIDSRTTRSECLSGLCPVRGLRRYLVFHLAKALPNKRVLILACSEIWIWIDKMTKIVKILLIQFILDDEMIYYTCLRNKILAWFMKVSWYNIGQ